MPLRLEDLDCAVHALRRLRARCPVLSRDLCWPISGGRDQDGYGHIGVMIQGKMHRLGAHRLAYLLANKTLPDAPLVIRHLCAARYALGDHASRRCCNPAHLAEGTVKDNIDDMVAMARQARGARHGSRTHPERYLRGEAFQAAHPRESYRRGENHYLWKNPDAAQYLHAALAAHPERRARGERHANARLTDVLVSAIIDRLAAGESQSSIARTMGIPVPTISDIALAKSWTHLPRPAHMAQPPYRKKRR